MELLEVFQKYFNPVHETPNDKQDSDLCKQCGGRCCHNLGCHIAPSDLKEITVESICNLIDESNAVSIDWWEGDPVTCDHTGERVFYLRIKNVDAKVIDPAFGANKCSILTENGCPLPFSYRPKGARDLIPKPCEEDCIDLYSKKQCSIEWIEYQDVLRKVYDIYYAKRDITNNFYTFLQGLLR